MSKVPGLEDTVAPLVRGGGPRTSSETTYLSRTTFVVQDGQSSRDHTRDTNTRYPINHSRLDLV